MYLHVHVDSCVCELRLDRYTCSLYGVCVCASERLCSFVYLQASSSTRVVPTGPISYPTTHLNTESRTHTFSMLQTRLRPFLFLLLSLGLLAVILQPSLAQDEFTCVGTAPVGVTNGQLNFSALPEGGTPFTYSYDPAIGGWYDLANGFVDTVRPGSLPYSKLLCALSVAVVVELVVLVWLHLYQKEKCDQEHISLS